MIYTCAPFVTWLIVAGQSPARTAAKYQHPPRWRRGRGRHSVRLKRKSTPAISQQVSIQERS